MTNSVIIHARKPNSKLGFRLDYFYFLNYLLKLRKNHAKRGRGLKAKCMHPNFRHSPMCYRFNRFRRSTDSEETSFALAYSDLDTEMLDNSHFQWIPSVLKGKGRHTLYMIFCSTVYTLIIRVWYTYRRHDEQNNSSGSCRNGYDCSTNNWAWKYRKIGTAWRTLHSATKRPMSQESAIP